MKNRPLIIIEPQAHEKFNPAEAHRHFILTAKSHISTSILLLLLSAKEEIYEQIFEVLGVTSQAN